ncbi:nuclear distribution protein RO10 [Histoplasma ohiense]|nr:nuclear distribution protein RO10 [Histoplasma ohiense (nom. inval.)]
MTSDLSRQQLGEQQGIITSLNGRITLTLSIPLCLLAHNSDPHPQPHPWRNQHLHLRPHPCQRRWKRQQTPSSC